MRLTGHEAIRYAEQNGRFLRKYADPVDGEWQAVTPNEARDVAREDPSLVYLDTDEGE